MKNVQIIGSGFSSLSAACYLAQAGYSVDVYEKNDSLGGRARAFRQDGSPRHGRHKTFTGIVSPVSG